MSNIVNVNTMTSREVAELTGKRHDHVIRDIKDEIAKLELGGEVTQLKFGVSEYTDSTGRKLPMYQLSIEGVLQLGARYDAITRSKLITMALQPKQYTLKESLQLNLQLLEDKEKLQKQLEIQAPKVEAYQSLMDSEDNYTINQAGKVLGIGEKKLFALLRDRNILHYDSNGHNNAYQKYVDAGYFVIKTVVYNKTRNTIQVLVTPKGLAWINKGLTNIIVPKIKKPTKKQYEVSDDVFFN